MLSLLGHPFRVQVIFFVVASAGRADLRLLRGEGFTVIVPLFFVASAGLDGEAVPFQ